MKLPESLIERLRRWAEREILTRIPDEVIGTEYLERWFVLKTWPLRIYVHEYSGNDNSRDPHDHPWFSFSIVLRGYIYDRKFVSVNDRPQLTTVTRLNAGDVRFMWPTHCHMIHAGLHHRLNILSNPSRQDKPLTLFIAFLPVRRWGFHTPKGWTYWKDYLRSS